MWNLRKVKESDVRGVAAKPGPEVGRNRGDLVRQKLFRSCKIKLDRAISSGPEPVPTLDASTAGSNLLLCTAAPMRIYSDFIYLLFCSNCSNLAMGGPLSWVLGPCLHQCGAAYFVFVFWHLLIF